MRNLKDCTFVVKLCCGDCGAQLNETKPLPALELYDGWTSIVMTSGFNAGRCPKGCRSTFSDLNINTDLRICDAESGRPFDFHTLKLLLGHFYQEDHAKICRCDNAPAEEVYVSDAYPAAHGVCGLWLEAFKRLPVVAKEKANG